MCSLIKNYFSLNRLKKQYQNRKISILMFYDKESVVSNKSRIQRFVILRKCVVSDYSYIGYNTNIYNASIGKFCSISKDVCIGLPSHPTKFISTSPLFVNVQNGTGYSWSKQDLFNSVPEKVMIGNDVWIGMKSTIMGGITIGNGAIIAAHSVVTKDVPPYAIVGGVPSKIIKYRFDDSIIETLQKSEWWNRSDDFLQKNIISFQEELSPENADRLTGILLK
jgi:acetyltransferase-like isoleucine patch superfamily enzyme